MDKKDVWPSHLKCLHADVPIRFSSNGTSSSYKDKVEDEFKLHSCTLSGKEKRKKPTHWCSNYTTEWIYLTSILGD